MMFAESRPPRRQFGSLTGRPLALLGVLACAILGSSAQAQTSIQWSPPESIYGVTNIKSAHARIATDRQQIEGVASWMTVWESVDEGSTTPSAVFASRSYTNGDNWLAPQRLDIQEKSGAVFPIADNLPSCHAPDVAASSRDRVFIAVWERGTTVSQDVPDPSDIGFAVYNSATDTKFITSKKPLTADMAAPDDHSADFAPSIDTDDHGNWMVVWRSDEPDPDVTTAPHHISLKGSTSSDNGATWSDPAIVADNVLPEAVPVVRSNKAGQWVVVWSDRNPDKDNGTPPGGTLDIFSTYSDNNGVSWSAPVSIVDEPDEFQDDIRPSLIYTPARGWIAAYARREGGQTFTLRTSTAAHPALWTGGQQLTSIPGPVGEVQLAFDGRLNVLAAWNATGGSRELLYSMSADFGQSWDAPATIALGQYAAPAIASDSKGKWVAAFGSTLSATPLFSTTVIPMAGQLRADLRIDYVGAVQAPLSQPHPLYANLPMDVTYSIENQGPDAAFDCAIWLSGGDADWDFNASPLVSTNRRHVVIVKPDDRAPNQTRVEVAFIDPLVPGEKTEITFHVKALKSGVRWLFANTFDQYDPYLWDNETADDLELEELPPLADLSVSMKSFPESGDGATNNGYLGRPMALIVNVTNNGPETARAVLLEEILDELFTNSDGVKAPAFTFTYAACSQGSWKYDRLADGRGRILCNFGDIPINGTVSLVIAVTPQQLGTFGHSATAQSINVASLDLTPEDASASAQFKVSRKRQTDLGVELTPETASAELGTKVTFTATVTNYGAAGVENSTAQHPRLILSLPEGAEPKSVRLDKGSFSRYSNGVVCGLKALPRGETATLVVEAIMHRGGSNMKAVATVSDFGSEDVITTNNRDESTVSVGAQALPSGSGSARIVSSGAAVASPLTAAPGSSAAGSGKKTVTTKMVRKNNAAKLTGGRRH